MDNYAAILDAETGTLYIRSIQIYLDPKLGIGDEGAVEAVCEDLGIEISNCNWMIIADLDIELATKLG